MDAQTISHEDRGAGWAMRYPADWQKVPDIPAASLVLCEPPRPDELFRANVNAVAQTLDTGFTPAQYATDQAAGLVEELESAFLIDLQPTGQGEVGLACTVVLAHVVEGIRVTLMQWHYRLPAQLLVLSATIETIEFALRREELERIARSVRLLDV